MPADDEQAIRRIYDAMSRSDIDELARDVTHDFELDLPGSLPYGGLRHGHDGVRAFIQQFQDHFEGPWAIPDDFFHAGDRVIVIGRTVGRSRTTGRTFEAPFAHVWTLTDGIASRCQSYTDSAPVIAALADRSPPDAA